MKLSKLLMIMLLMISVAACNTKTTVTNSNAKTIILSDDKILYNNQELTNDDSQDVYISSDIIYYEDMDVYPSGNKYGEGKAEDKHSLEEASSHTVINITKAGTYEISGELSKGQIFIDLGEEAKSDVNAKVTLILNNVDINCDVAPAVFFYRVYEVDEDFVAYDNGESDEYNNSGEIDTSNAGANVIIKDGSVNNIEGSHVAKIFKDNEGEKKLHKYDGAFYSRQSININGETQGDGVLNIKADNEGLNSEMHLTINGGKINIESDNDGINTNEDNVSITTINGGSLHIVAGLGEEGDGIDSNGYLNINGGTVISIAKPIADSGLDSDLGTHINGGYVFAAGSMMDTPSENSKQVTVNLSFAQMQNNDEAVVIVDENDKVVFAYDPDKDETTGMNNRQYQGVILSSPNIKKDATYNIYLGGEVEGVEVDGLYDVSSVKTYNKGTLQMNGGLIEGGRFNPGQMMGNMPGMNFQLDDSIIDTMMTLLDKINPGHSYTKENLKNGVNIMEVLETDITIVDEVAELLLEVIKQINPESTITVDDIKSSDNLMNLFGGFGGNQRPNEGMPNGMPNGNFNPGDMNMPGGKDFENFRPDKNFNPQDMNPGNFPGFGGFNNQNGERPEEMYRSFTIDKQVNTFSSVMDSE